MNRKSTSLVIRESGTQLIPWDHICCGLPVQTIGSRFAPNSYLKLCESIGFPKLAKQLTRNKSINNNNVVIEDNVYKLSDQQINNIGNNNNINNINNINKHQLENDQLVRLEMISNIDDKQLPEYSTELTKHEFLIKFIDPKLLTYEKSMKIIEELSQRMKNEYYFSIKLSILDYILKTHNLFVETKLTENKFRNYFNYVKQLNIKSNLTSDPTFVQFIQLWETKYSNINIFDFNLFKILDINDLKAIIAQNCQKMNFKLKYEWISDCNQILLNDCSKLINYDCIQNIRFFDSIASLMSRLLRELVLKNVENWIQILSNNFEKSITMFRIDIKCKSRGDPYFIPSLSKWREILSFPLICLLDSTKDIGRVENNLILLETKRPSKFLFDIKLDDNDVKDYHDQILSILDKINFYDIMENYKKEFTEKLSKIMGKFQINNQNPEYIAGLFETCRNIVLDLKVSANELNIGIFEINFYDFKIYVKKCIEDQLNSVVESQLIMMISLAKQMCYKFLEIEQELKAQSNSCDQLINNIKQMKRLKSTINLMLFDVQYIENNWNSFVENGTKLSLISESDFEVLHQMYYWPKRIQLCFNEREKRLQTENFEIQNKLRSKITGFEKKLNNLSNILDNFENKKISSAFENILDNCRELKDINNLLEEYSTEYNDLNHDQEVLQWKSTDFSILEQLIKRTTNLDNVWRTASLFKETETQCMSESVRSLDLKDIRHNVETLLNSCKQMNTTFKCNNLLQNVNYLQTNIESFKINYIPLIEVFSSHILRERHFHRINEIIGQRICWTQSQTLGEVVSVSNPIKYIDEITTVGKIACKEFELEMLLGKMKDEWVDEWPEEALEIVANKYLEEETLEFEIRQKCAKAFKFIHLNSLAFVAVVNQQIKDNPTLKYCVTAPMFIELLVTFKDLLRQKLNQLSSERNRYLEAIENLNSVANSLKQMKNQMTNDFQPIILMSFIETENMMITIEKETLKIEIQKEMIACDEAMANRSAAGAQQIKDECYKELSQAVPAIKSSINALNTLKSEDITQLRSMKCPPPAVRTIVEAVCILNDCKPERKLDPLTNYVTEDYWSSSQRMFSDFRFLEKLKNFDRNSIQRNAIELIRQKYLHSEHFEPTALKRVSNACEGLANWVRAIDIYDRLINVVKPKRERLRAAETELKAVLQTLEHKKCELRKTTDFLQKLNDEFSTMSKKKRELEDNRDKCRSKLIRVQQITEKLKATKMNWTQICDQLKEQKHQIIPELVLCSALMTYTSSLTAEQRYSFVNKWRNYLENECNFSFGKAFSFVDTLGDNNKMLKWAQVALPNHQFDIENAIISDKSRRLPVIIDRNNVINQWLSHLYPDLTRLDFDKDQDNFKGLLTEAIERGGVILIENIHEISSNEVIGQLIESIANNEKQTQFFQFGKEAIPLGPGFKVYICSEYITDLSPKILTEISLINWTTTQMNSTTDAKDVESMSDVQQNYILDLKTNIEKEEQLVENDNRFIQLISEEKSILLNEKNFIDLLVKNADKPTK